MSHHPIRPSHVLSIAASGAAVVAAYLLLPARAVAFFQVECPPNFCVVAGGGCPGEEGQDFTLENNGEQETWCLPECDASMSQQEFEDAIGCPEIASCIADLFKEWQKQCGFYEENPTPIEGPFPGPNECGARPETLSTPSAGAPVDLFNGDKVEIAKDLHVRVTGLDFVVSREYTSNPEYDSSALIGEHWTSSLFRSFRLDPTPPPSGCCNPCTAHWASGRVCNFGCPGCDPELLPSRLNLEGPTAQFFEKKGATIGGPTYAVWRLTEPGQWEMDFFRIRDAGEGFSQRDVALIGRLAVVRDMYGNTWEYQYSDFGDGFLRLSAVKLNENVSGVSEALVVFAWNTAPTSVNFGKLTSIVVKRPDKNEDLVETQRVYYTYMDTSTPSLFSDDLGIDGDLIQVARHERVDPESGAPAGTEAWRIRLTQYRYHGNTGSTGARDFTWSGNDHQLKMVILPEQIEYAAQQQADFDGSGSIESYGDALLIKVDDAEAWGGQAQVIVADMAAKVIESYENWIENDPANLGRVDTQYLQSNCGCGGGSTQGLKLTYEYFSWGGDEGHTTKITEHKDPPSWQLHRTLYYDTQLQGPAPGMGDPDLRAPYLVTKAIIDGSNQWVTHYVYDEDERTVVRMMTPSAKQVYKPIDAPEGLSYTAYADQGLVYAYAYSGFNYRTEVRLAKGFLDQSEGNLNKFADYTLISRTAYGIGGNTRIYLPNKVEWIRTEGVNPDPPANKNEVEVVEYTYGFHGIASSGDDLAWTETKVEAELESENGPDGTYSSFELFDQEGKNYWSIAADDSYTKRVFDVDDSSSVSATGEVVRIIRNAHKGIDGFPTAGELPPSPPPDRNDDGGSLVTEYVRDLLGRVQERVTPGLVSTYTRREMRDFPDRTNLSYYAEVTLPHEIQQGAEYNGPGTITWYNADDNVIGSSDYGIKLPKYIIVDPLQQTGYTVRVTVYELDGDDMAETGQLARSVIEHDVSGLITASKVWHSLDGHGQGAGIYTTSYVYDSLGRVQDTTNDVLTITHNEYDVLDRVIEVSVGTTPANLNTVTEYFYDSGGNPSQGEGNGNLTFVRQHVDGQGATSQRDTVNSYDFRDRLETVENPIAPHTLFEYDNLDRLIKQAVFSSMTPPPDIDTTTGRERYTETAYSQRGLVYRQRLGIDPTLGTLTFLETHTWYDEVGRPVGMWPLNGPGSKTSYDGLGRPVTTYVTDRRDDAAPGAVDNHAHVYLTHKAQVDGDVVFEQMSYSYILDTETTHVGQLDLATTRRRTHDADDTKTGDLSGFTAPDDKLVITTYAGTDYDGADRVIRSINFGTNDDLNQQFVFGGAPPTKTNNNWNTDQFDLITTTTYDVRGLTDTSADPENKFTKYFYDDLNRSKAVVEDQINLTEADIGWNLTEERWKVTGGLDPDAPDEDRVTSFVYDGISNLIKQVAHLPGGAPGGEGGVQVTEYAYGVDTDAAGNPLPSDIYSNDLLGNVIHPDEGSGGASEADRTVFYAYNRQGELITMEDQNDTRHDYQRDLLGRVDLDKVINFGTSIDQAITEIGTTYDGAGRVEFVTSSNSSQQVVNEVEFGYNPLWQIVDVWQDPDGPVDAGSLRVTYTYGTESAPSGGNFSRPITLTYPDGSQLVYDYGLGNPPVPPESNFIISRVEGLLLSGASVAEYDYIGLSMFAVVDLPEPDVQLDRTASHTGERQTEGHSDNPGKYPGFDRFGRVLQDMWVDFDFETHDPMQGSDPDTTLPRIPPIVEFTYAYDEASNRLKRDNETATIAFGFRHETFNYDGLDRVDESARGVRSGSNPQDPYTSHHRTSQKWSLDVLGNWEKVESVPNPGPPPLTYQIEELRNHNGVNELLDRDPDGFGVGEDPLDLTYDKAGNLREQEIKDDPLAPPPVLIKLVYTHDAWNRLVRVEIDDGGTPEPRGEYAYNGLNWRIIKRSDSDLVDSINALDQQRLMYYSPSWQLLEERIDDDAPFTSDPQAADIDRQVQYVWGQRYIDDIVLHRQVGGTAYYHMTDVQFSTVAIIDQNAVLVERISYNAYGHARHHLSADFSGDGDVSVPDQLLLLGNWGSYGVGDLDRNGTVGVPDLLAMLAQWDFPPEPSGQLSSSTVDNQIGYDGYVFNVETQQYHVRNRCYDPLLGRWLERDPLGLTDGMNLFEYTRSNPVTNIDPFGLGSCVICQNSEQYQDCVQGCKDTRADRVRKATNNRTLCRSMCAPFYGICMGRCGTNANKWGVLCEIRHRACSSVAGFCDMSCSNVYLAARLVIQTAYYGCIGGCSGDVRSFDKCPPGWDYVATCEEYQHWSPRRPVNLPAGTEYPCGPRM